MNEVTLQAHGKINLTLDVTGKLPNGYHTVEMVMQTLALCDDVTVRRGAGTGIELQSNWFFLPTNTKNLAVRAALTFFEQTGIQSGGIQIVLHKRIPAAAGLAGGSSNAAAVLKALNQLYKTDLSQENLCEIGLKIGADVPYCLRGGSMLATGIGEVLTPLAPMPPCFVVVCKPPFSVSTAKIYAQMDEGDIAQRPDTQGMRAALAARDYLSVCRCLNNVMEPVVSADHAAVQEIKSALLLHGADGAAMSGSGPTVFGLFHEKEKAQSAAVYLGKHYKDTFLTNILQQ